MTYTDSETSVDDGGPVELYEFRGPIRGYFYTSHVEDVLFTDTNIYRAIPIQRGPLQGASQDDSPELEIRVPFDLELVQDYAYNISPNDLQLTIHRFHLVTGIGQSITYWRGSVATITVTDRIATIRVPSILGQRLTAPVPSIYYQSQCNHVLYDGRCAVARSGFQVDTSVSSVNVNGTVVVVSSVGGNVDQFFKAGEIIRTGDGERRLIVDQVGATLTLNFPFPELQTADSVSIFAGCDRTAPTCRDKFSNIENFGGHPFIPDRNVFETGIN